MKKSYSREYFENKLAVGWVEALKSANAVCDLFVTEEGGILPQAEFQGER